MISQAAAETETAAHMRLFRMQQQLTQCSNRVLEIKKACRAKVGCKLEGEDDAWKTGN